MNKELWTTKDGQIIAVEDMSDGHLVNTISMIQRKAEIKRSKTGLFYTLCTPPTGEMAQDCFDSEFNNAIDANWADYAPEIYWAMLSEAEKRNLKLKPELDLTMNELHILSKKVK